MQITRNRRIGMRIPATGEALVRVGEHPMRCPCIDVSARGIALLAPFAATPGSHVELSMMVHGELHELRARVARSKRGPQGWLWGLTFGGRSTLASAIQRGHERLVWMRQALPYLSRLGPEANRLIPGALGLEIAVPEPLDSTSRPSNISGSIGASSEPDVPLVPVRTGLTEPQTVIPPLVHPTRRSSSPARPATMQASPPPPRGSGGRGRTRIAPSRAAADRRFRAVVVDELDLDDGPTTIYDRPDDAGPARSYIRVG